MSYSSNRSSPPRRYAQPGWEGGEGSSYEPSRATVAPLRSVDISNVGPAASPLEQLGRLAGTARKGSLEAVPSSEPSSSTLRPQLASSSSSPLVFNSFRNSTASDSSTYYTSSIYSNSEDNHAYWEGRRPEDDEDEQEQSDEDDARTERGGDDDRDELEEIDDDDDEDTTIDDHGGGGVPTQQQYYRSVGLRSEDSSRNSPNFTTSSRISRMLLDSAQDEDEQDQDTSFGSQWSASSAYSSASSREQVSRRIPSQSVVPKPSDAYSSSPPASSPLPSPPPSHVRNASIGGVTQRRAEVTRPQIEISSVYGDAGNQWDGGDQDWNRATPSRPPFPSEPSRGGPSPSSPGSSNFSRPMKLSGVGASSPLAGGSSASRQKDYIDPPQRSASLRRKGTGEAPQLARSPSPPWTPPFEHDRKSIDPVPFPQHPIPSPTPSAALPSPSFSPRLPSTLRQQSSSSTSTASSRPQSPPATSPVSPTTPYGPPRPKFATNTFGSNSSISSISSLPTRRAPPPPVDRPAFNGTTLTPSDTPSVRLVPSFSSANNQQPYRQAHPSNGAANWQPTLPSSSTTTSSSSSSKFTPQLPSQRKSTYPPSPALPLQPQGLQPNLSASSQRIRAYSESEQGHDSSTRPGLSPLTGTNSGPPSFAAVPPKPSFTVTSRDRSGSSGSSSATSPLSQQSSSSSEREIVGTPASLRLSPGTSRAELHPGLFSVYELGPSSRSASPTRESFASPATTTIKESYTKVEIVDEPSHTRSPSSSRSQPSLPSIRMGPEQYLKLGISHHSNQHSSDDLSLAAMYFREAATLDGGCQGGMLFWGLTLRSGWGVVKDERKGFEWLRRACEPRAMSGGGGGGEGGMGAGGGRGTEPAALAPEMVVAILEVAQCFLHGWGCAKDPEKAVSYLLVAAKMGDVDAQLQLASCYLHGLGTKGKKDKVQSAFWFRAAIAQGASDSGLSWVHKRKYMKEG